MILCMHVQWEIKKKFPGLLEKEKKKGSQL